VDVIAIGGDGGTFDIGIQALSGALERGHDMVYLCYDNEAYMNTGIQRSGATPHGAATTTSPAGSKIPGKPEWKKDFAGICIAHGIPYVATATLAYWNDYLTKLKKAIEVEGPTVLHVLAPCPLGWRSDPKDTIKLSRLATQTRYFPLYEYEEGKHKLNINVPKPLPVEEFLKLQGRFRHLFKPDFKKEIEEIQRFVNINYDRIAKLCSQT
jgi:pyruvate ferredoxin oxidoreductase beta subunit